MNGFYAVPWDGDNLTDMAHYSHALLDDFNSPGLEHFVLACNEGTLIRGSTEPLLCLLWRFCNIYCAINLILASSTR